MRKTQNAKRKAPDSRNIDYTDYTPKLQKLARQTGEYAHVLFNLRKCVFCDLREKYIIAERGKVALTVNLFPYLNGHLQIIPRRHLLRLDQLKVSEWRAVRGLTELGMKLLRQAYGIKNTHFIYREGERAGKTVWHLHFHLIPYEVGLLDWHYRKITEEPAKVAEKLRGKLS